MIKKIYLDNNATTECNQEVLDTMIPYFKEQFGNPSSLYAFGKKVKEEIIKVRRNISTLINADIEEIIFTSSGSESNVTAIMSAVNQYPKKKHIITTKVEHASVLETMKYLEEKGYSITYLSVDSEGNIDLNELKSVITNDTLLISIMVANNEIGTIYPIKEIGKIAKQNNILFHVDAVQAIGKIKIDVKEMNIDTLSFSGHKINAPKGIGVLYVNKNINFKPLIFGHQENNRRGGTENVPYIIGLGKAIEMILEDNYEKNSKIAELRDYMESKIKENISDIRIYGNIENRMSNTSSIAFKGVGAEELLFVLESYNIFVSTGSACNSEIAEPSHVLVACNADLDNYSPIRISSSKDNTKEEIDYFLDKLIKSVKMLRNLKEKKNGK